MEGVGEMGKEEEEVVSEEMEGAGCRIGGVGDGVEVN